MKKPLRTEYSNAHCHSFNSCSIRLQYHSRQSARTIEDPLSSIGCPSKKAWSWSTAHCMMQLFYGRVDTVLILPRQYKYPCTGKGMYAPHRGGECHLSIQLKNTSVSIIRAASGILPAVFVPVFHIGAPMMYTDMKNGTISGSMWTTKDRECRSVTLRLVDHLLHRFQHCDHARRPMMIEAINALVTSRQCMKLHF